MTREHQIFANVFNMHRVFFACVQRCMEGEKLHPRQAPILVMLLHHDGASQADITRMMKVSAATVAVSVARLEKLSYVTRVRNKDNQRANILQLTDQGKQKAKLLEETMGKISKMALHGFTEPEKGMLDQLCIRMVQNLTREYHIKEACGHYATHD